MLIDCKFLMNSILTLTPGSVLEYICENNGLSVKTPFSSWVTTGYRYFKPE